MWVNFMLKHGVNLDTKREDRTIFIISLLLHTLVLLFLLFYAFKARQKFVIIKSDTQKQIKLIPKKSDMETEVVFDDHVLPPPVAKKEKPKQAKPAQSSSIPTALIPKRSDMGTEVVSKKKYEHEKTVNKTEKQEDVPKTPAKINRKHENKESLIKKVIVQQPITTPKLQQAALANLFQEKPEPKRKKTLAHCFMDQEGGNSCLAKFGKKGVPSIEEMKYICYEKRINDQIMSSWRMRFGGAQIRTRGSVSLSYVINEDGKVENLTLISSSGSKMFDDMVLKCIRNANFPPIPKHFGVKKYRPRGGYVLLK
jgi:protein TonB